MIRPAAITDAPQAAPLLCAAWGHLAIALTGAESLAEAELIVAEFFVQSENRFSHENALVAERDGSVVGIALCYHGSQAVALDRPLTLQLMTRTKNSTAAVTVEAEPDEFYLDTLSVQTESQRQGIGGELVQAFERRAAEQNYRKLGLLVETDNEPAQRLYVKLGYEAAGTVRLAGSLYDHRVKQL
jgi:ribosomal protein S18 acetylase RimI-like enzyme